MGYCEDSDELLSQTQEDVRSNIEEIESQGDNPEFSMVVVGNRYGKIFTSRWVEGAEGNALDMIRGLADLVDAIDEDQFYSNSASIERGEIIGAMRGCLQALQNNPDVTFNEVIEMEADY